MSSKTHLIEGKTQLQKHEAKISKFSFKYDDDIVIHIELFLYK